MPAFDRRLSITKPLVSETGVYRYIYDDEVVYIGQGVLRSRFSEKIRESWNYDDVEYMVIESEDERFNIEKKLLDEHKQVNGKLPFYNRVGGRNVR
jgi:excinuclease UvrABC nuclease subunit